MPKLNLFSPSQFAAIAPKLAAALTAGLEKERTDCALPQFGGATPSDLWNLPPIDSKSVAKLSPVVKDLTGHRLNPAWIRKGGYASVEEAVADILAHFQTHCVAKPAPAPAEPALSH